MSTSDHTIVKKCQEGDTSEFGILYDKYIKAIYSYIYYRVQHKETTEDLTSTVFIKTIEKIGTFDPEKGSFSSWLYRIAKNSVSDHFRQLKFHGNIDDIWDLSDNTDIPRDADNRIKLDKVKKYLQKLKPEQREIVVLRVWDQLPYKEISDITGKSEVNCKVILSRALAEIRNNEVLYLLLLAPLFFDL